jgi:hypothetical protein
MANKLDDGAYVDFIDRHIEELDERIRALKNRMAAMVLEKYEIRNQEVLLGAMLETRKDLEKFRAELVQEA